MKKGIPCSLCVKNACSVETELNEHGNYLVHVKGFSGHGQHGVSNEIFYKLEEMLEIENWWYAHKLNREFVLGYCKDCDKVYCRDHWSTLPIWDGILL